MPSAEIRQMAPLDMGDRVRFITKVLIRDEAQCWPWTGGTSPANYGTIKMRLIVDGKPGVGTDGWELFLSNRVAYNVFYGLDPAPRCVLHTCDNPPCCNPYHLFLGTLGENNTDRARKIRTAGTRLNAEIIPEIFGMSRQGKSSTEIAAIVSNAIGGSIHPRTIRDVLIGKTWAWLKHSG